MSRDVRREEQPFDRLSRLSAAMIEAMEAHLDYQDGDRCAIFMSSPHDSHGMTAVTGFEDDASALASIMQHVEALAKVNGMTLTFVPMEGPVGSG
jgi:hypothetical protein